MAFKDEIIFKDFVRYEDNDKVFVGLRPDKILHIYFKSKLVVDLKTQKWLIEIYKRVSNEQPIPVMVESGEFVRIEKEAKEHSRKVEHELFLICTSAIVKNFAHLMVARLYVKFYKPVKPFKIFKNRSEAIIWSLEQLKLHHDK